MLPPELFIDARVPNVPSRFTTKRGDDFVPIHVCPDRVHRRRCFDGLDLLSPASPASRSPFGDDGVGVVSARSGVDPDSASLRASVRDENATAGASAITGDSGIASASFARVYASASA